MSVQLQEVLKTDTLEIQRQKFNTLALDTFNVLAGGTNLSAGTVGIADGTVTAPALYFNNQTNLGLFRAGDREMGFASNGQMLFSVGDDEYTGEFDVPDDTVNLYTRGKVFTPSGIQTASVNDAGLNYLKGEYLNVALTNYSGATGTGATGNITISGLSGSITDGGSGYTPGTYPGINLENQSRTTTTLTGSILDPGYDYVAGTYNNVPLTGGSGIGAEATIVVVSDTGQVYVSSVTITNGGTGYQVNDILGATDANLGAGGSGAGFQYRVDTFEDIASGASADIVVAPVSGSVTAVGNGAYTEGEYENVVMTGGSGSGFTVNVSIGSEYNPSISSIVSYGSGYAIGDVLELNASDVGGSGSGFQYTMDTGTNVSSVTINADGKNYLIGDVLTVSGAFLGSSGANGASVATAGSNYAWTGTYTNVPLTGGTGTGAVGTLTFANGSLSSVAITFGGSGYAANDTLSFANSSVGGDFIGGVLSQVQVTAGGTGYADGTYTNVSVNGGNGVGLTIDITVSFGSIISATVNSGGYSYSAGDTFTVAAGFDGVGNGGSATFTTQSFVAASGATINVDTIFGSGSGFEYTVNGLGSVTAFTLVNGGSGYDTSSMLSVDTVNIPQADSEVAVVPLLIQVDTAGQSKVGQLDSTGDLYLSNGVGIGLDMNNLSPLSDKLEVRGGTAVFGGTVKLSDGSIDIPSVSFENQSGIGIYKDAEDIEQNFAIKTAGGKAAKFSRTDISLYKDLKNVLQQIDTFSITGGSGFTVGSYTNIPFEGGSGSGAIGDVIVAFSVALSGGGGGYLPASGTETYSAIPITGGSGSGAEAQVTVTDGVVTKVFISNEGNNAYQVGDSLSLDPADMDPQQAGSGTGSGANLIVSALGAVSFVSFSNKGIAYEPDDDLTISDASRSILSGGAGFASAGDGFLLSVDTVTTTEQGKYDIAEGVYESLGFKSTDTLGFSANGSIVLNETSLTKSTAGNLVISADTNSFVQIGGTGALQIPAGTEAQKQAISPSAGAIRFNTETQAYEAYDGANWGSLGGTRDVDGNTYILPESAPGANENILFFYNDGVNSLDVEQTKIVTHTANLLEAKNLAGLTLWTEGAAATAAAVGDPPVLVYYGDNVYSVDTTGTFDADASNFPTHTTGTVTNGTVDLTWFRTIWGGFTVRSTNLNLDLKENGALTFGSNYLQVSSTSSASSIKSIVSEFNVEMGSTPSPLLQFTSGGAINVNNGFGSSPSYIQVLDSGLRAFELKDLQTITNKSNLVKGTTNSANFVVYDPVVAVGAKVTIIADNTTAGEKEILELSVIDSGSDIYNIEIGDVYTSASKIIDVELDFNASNQVRLTYTLDASVATADDVSVTVISQRIKK